MSKIFNGTMCIEIKLKRKKAELRIHKIQAKNLSKGKNEDLEYENSIRLC